MDHLRDGAGAEPEAHHGGHPRVDEPAQPGAGDRRHAADQPEPDEQRQRRTLLRDRREDGEPFGRVVQREADDQQRAERGLAERERRADRQPFAEVVQADPDRDEQREHRAGAGRGGLASGARAPRAATARSLRGRGRPWRRRRRRARSPGTRPASSDAPSSPSWTASTNRNASSPIVTASSSVEARSAQPRQHREPAEAERDRQHADVEADQRKRPEVARRRLSAFRPRPGSRARTAFPWT